MNLMCHLKELFSAYYDPNTNKIMNCTEGSIIWHHENRHLIQQEKYGYFTHLTLAIWIVLTLIIITEEWILSYLLLIGLIVPEIDAWIYAIIKWGELK